MASKYHRGRRVSASHHAILNAYERKYNAAVQLNQGRRTIAEQTRFWLHYLRFGSPLAARPYPGAPHIKYNKEHHALDINAGSGRGQAQHVAQYYRSLGIPVAFNVRSEPWHMDTLNEQALKNAARKQGLDTHVTLKYKSKGPSVVRLKKLLWDKGIKGFSSTPTGKPSDNRYNPFFGKHTRDAVKKFQRANGLVADGVVGAGTWRKLKSK
jgi:hypothetical protein